MTRFMTVVLAFILLIAGIVGFLWWDDRRASTGTEIDADHVPDPLEDVETDEPPTGPIRSGDIKPIRNPTTDGPELAWIMDGSTISDPGEPYGLDNQLPSSLLENTLSSYFVVYLDGTTPAAIKSVKLKIDNDRDGAFETGELELTVSGDTGSTLSWSDNLGTTYEPCYMPTEPETPTCTGNYYPRKLFGHLHEWSVTVDVGGTLQAITLDTTPGPSPPADQLTFRF